MRIPLLVAMTIAVALSSARALDLDLGVDVGKESSQSDDLRAAKDAWAVQVCRTATEADQVAIEVGQPGGKNAEIMQVWDRKKTSDEGNVQTYVVPKEYRQSGKIWVNGVARPKNRKVHMAVAYDGNPKRIFNFDKTESHNVGVKDPNTTFRCPK